MNYTEEEIERFIEILKSVDKSPSPSPQSTRVTCKQCHCPSFLLIRDITIHQIVFFSHGHVLGYYHKSEYERFYFRHKPIYQKNITIKTRLKK